GRPSGLRARAALGQFAVEPQGQQGADGARQQIGAAGDDAEPAGQGQGGQGGEAGAEQPGQIGRQRRGGVAVGQAEAGGHGARGLAERQSQQDEAQDHIGQL